MTRRALALFLAAAGCAAPGEAAAPLLVPAASSPVGVGAGPGQLALVDLDGDGRLDLVTRHLLGKSVTVLRGDGRGGFADRSSLPLDTEPGAMALGDVNGDGRADLVVASRGQTHEILDVLLGADGGALNRVGSPVPLSPAQELYKPSVVLADLDGDGRLDAAFSNGQRKTVDLLLGDGRGGLRVVGTVDLGKSDNVSSFALADVDDDKRLDLVAATDAGVTIRPGDGRGAFGAPAGPPLAVPARPKIEAAADVDGDGRVDLVLSHDDRSSLTVLLQQQRGQFVAAPGSPFDLGKPVSAVLVSDVDGDAAADLVIAAVDAQSPFASEITVLLGPRFVPSPGSPFPAGVGAYNLAVGDVNADGRLDVAASNWESDCIVLLLGRR
jgi:hypothetical protein